MKHNPSADVAYSLADTKISGFHSKSVILPVSFKDAFSILKEEIEKFDPDFVLALGLARKRKTITLERIGINLMDASIPDNEGLRPKNEIIYQGEPDGIFSRLPLAQMIEASKRSEVEVLISNSAGTYVCNRILFELLVFEQERKFRSGFVHLPPFEKMDFESQLRGLRSMIMVLD